MNVWTFMLCGCDNYRKRWFEPFFNTDTITWNVALFNIIFTATWNKRIKKCQCNEIFVIATAFHVLKDPVFVWTETTIANAYFVISDARRTGRCGCRGCGMLLPHTLLVACLLLKGVSIKIMTFWCVKPCCLVDKLYLNIISQREHCNRELVLN